MTRISTETFYRQFTNSLQAQQKTLAKLQEQISYGRRIISPADDPVGAARSINITQSLGRVDQYIRNGSYAQQRLGLEETSLESLTNLLQRVRELAISAANTGTQSSETFNAIRVELQQRQQEMLNLGNTRDSNGEYIFSGFQGQTQSFTLTAAGVQYNGDQGQLQLQIGTSKQVAVNDSGYDVFQSIRNGNGQFAVSANAANTGSAVIASGSVIDNTTFQAHDFTIQFTSMTTYDVINNTTGATIIAGAAYTEGTAINFNGIETSISGAAQTGDEFFVRASRNEDMFTTMQNFINALADYPTNAAENAQKRQQMQTVLMDIDQSLNHVINIRAEVGGRLNAIETSADENESVSLELTRNLSEIRDLDYAEAISTLQFQLTSLEAAEQSFGAIERLSLFDFIR